MKLVGVGEVVKTSVDVAEGMFVFVGKNVGVEVGVVLMPPMTTGVGLKIEGVREGGTNGVGGS